MEENVALGSCYSIQSVRCSSSFLLAFLSGVLVFTALPALGQVLPDGQLLNGETAKPVPGGHDYIHLAVETVNPSNGSVSVKFDYPMPKGRGFTIPFAPEFNTGGLYHVGVSVTNGDVEMVPTAANVGVYPIAGWSMSSFTVPSAPPPAPQWGVCNTAGGFNFIDQHGVSHNLGLAVMANAQNYTNSTYCETVGNGSAGVAIPSSSGQNPPPGSGDGQVWAIWTSPSQTATDVMNFQNGVVGPFTVTDKEGTTYFFSGGGLYDSIRGVYTATPNQIEDRNGNVVTINIDTLGRQITTSTTVGGLTYPSGTCPSCPSTTNVVYNSGQNGTTALVTTLQRGDTSVSCPAYNLQVNSTVAAATVFALPTSTPSNPQQYILYNGNYSPNGTGNPYGLLNELIYPDGGWVKYTWKMSNTDPNNPYTQSAFFTGNGMSNGSSSGNTYGQGCGLKYNTPVLASRTVSFDGNTVAQTQTFTYQTIWNGWSWTSKQTSVLTTDNISGNSFLTVYNYAPGGAPGGDPLMWGSRVAPGIPIESSILYYSGSSTSTPLLRKVTKTWYDMFDPQEVDTTENGLTSKTVYCYVGTSCVPTASLSSPFYLLQSKSDYDFTGLIRSTNFSYQSFPSNTITYQSNSVIIPVPSRPNIVQVKNSGGTVVAETDYSYDGAALGSVTAVQHDDSNYGTGLTNRGNATSVTHKCIGCTNAVTSYTYDLTGQPASMTDPNGNKTTYSFADSPTGGNSAGQSNAYLTQVTYPKTGSIVHQESFQYNYVFGDLTQSTDQNGQISTYQYADSFDRLTKSAFPDGGVTNIAYTDSPTSPMVATCELITGSSGAACSATSPPSGWKTSVALMDGMYHTKQTQLPSDPDLDDYVDISFDGLGRKRTVSNPHRTAASSTDGTASTTYDALGRPTQVKEQDGSTVQTAYDQTCTSNTSTLGTLVTDEAGNQRRSCTDGLGRLVEVDEPGQSVTNSATPATGSFTISGSEQSKQTSSATSGHGQVTVSGSEQSQTAAAGTGSISVSSGTASCILVNQNPPTYAPQQATISVTINGATANPTGWGGSCNGSSETIQPSLTQFVTNLTSAINSSGAGVTATANGTNISLTAKTTGANTNYSVSITETYGYSSSQYGTGYTACCNGSLSGGRNGGPDTGSVSVIVDGYTASAAYGSSSTASSLASALFTAFNNSNSPVSPSGTNPITLTSKATGSSSNYSGTSSSASTNGFSPASFSASPASFTFTGGANAGYTYDTGTVSVTVGTFTATVNYGSSDTPSTVANNLATYFNTTSGSPVTANAVGATVSLITIATGTQADYTYSGSSSTNQSGTFSSPSFSASTQGSAMTGGDNATTTWSMSTPFVTLYNYDVLGNLTCVEQHGGVTGTGCSSAATSDATSQWRVRRFSYDSLSRLLTSENPETGGLAGQIYYTYDANGNLASKKTLSPNQPVGGTATVTTSYTYDALNRLTGKMYADTYGSNSATPPVLYGYDGVPLSGCAKAPPSLTDSYAIGRRTSMCDGSSTVPGSGSTSWSHDPMGRVLKDNRFIASVSAAKSVTYTYNPDGSMQTVTAPDGKTVTYVVGGAGRPLSAKDGSGNNYVTSATYTPPGELASLLNGAAIHGALSYNARLQPLQIFYGTNTPPTITSSTCPTTVGNIMHKVYAFNSGSSDNGNVVSITNCITTTRSQSFSYDPLNRIASAQSSGNQWGETFTIDAWGNMTNESGISGKQYAEGLSAFPATNKNQLPGFTYDAAGNMTKNGGTTYIYDAENRLIWTTGGYRYIYDGDGNRVEKCVAGSATTPCPTSGTNGTLYWMGAGNAALDESDLSGNMLEQYVFFGSARVARRDVSTGTVHYYFSDHLGSHSVIENATGTVTEQDIDYYPYGGQENDYSPNVAQHYKFNGKERDTESGLDNFGARFDASNLGRFMTPDWAEKPTAVPYAHYGNPQSLNLYSYAQNNPTTVGDPDGHAPFGWGGFGADCDGAEKCQAALAANNAASNKQAAAQNTVTVEQVKGQGVNGGPLGFDHAAVSVNGQQAVGLEPKKDTGTVVEDKTVPGAVRAVDPNREVKDKATIQVTPDQAGKIQTFLDNAAKNPPNYNLYHSNCAQFCERALQAGGVKNVPNDMTPHGLVEDLKSTPHWTDYIRLVPLPVF